MATGVLMPKAGISVESCIIGTWFKNPGDAVKIGDILFDYETDKATFECESTAEGTLIESFFESGDEVPCLTVVCAVGNAGEDVSSLKPTGVAASAPAAASASEAMTQTVAQTTATLPFTPESTTTHPGAATPRAKKLAERMKVDLSGAVPTGPRGRIIERDILTAAENNKSGGGIGGRRADGFIGAAEHGAAGGGMATHRTSDAAYTDEKMSPIRKVIAKSMVKSLTEIAQLTHQHSCDATVLLNMRKRFKNANMGLEGISLNDLILFAVARTLHAHPDMNAHLLNGDTLRRFNGVHLGVAVDTPRGLMVPTVFDADKMSLLELSHAVKDVAAQAKSGNISPDLLQGASFTVSNLGALGVEMFTPVINPPQVGILGVCGISQKVREGKDGGIALYPSLGLSLTYDHRAIDGAPASRFAAELAKNLENMDILLAF